MTLTRSELLTYLDEQGIQTFVTALLDDTHSSATIYFMNTSELAQASERLLTHPGIAEVVRAEVSRRPVLQVVFAQTPDDGAINDAQ